jgi:hypothetical protein
MQVWTKRYRALSGYGYLAVPRYLRYPVSFTDTTPSTPSKLNKHFDQFEQAGQVRIATTQPAILSI